MRKDHLNALHRVLSQDNLPPKVREAFEGMLGNLTDQSPPRYLNLSTAQYEWVKRELDKHEPQYKNLFSSGNIPRGAEVPVPKALQNLPKRPPGRINHGE